MQVGKSKKMWWMFAISFILVGCIVWLVMQNDKDNVVPDDVEAIVPTADIPLAANDKNDKVISEEPSQPEELEPSLPEEVEPQYLTSSLQDDPSYDEGKVQSITVQNGSNERYTVPKNREYIILQSLYWIDLTLAKAEDQTITEDNIMIYINNTDRRFAIPYDINNNTFQLGDLLYYASMEVAELMHGQFKQESKLALMDRISTKASEEESLSESSIDAIFEYDDDQITINGMDFNGWEQRLSNDYNYVTIVNYYDDGSEEMSSVRYYEDLAIVSQREILFISDSIATKDGIKIGLSKEEVLTRLGKPNYATESQWSYSIRDYVRFQLYFEDNKVVFISLIMPL